jgi:hypothetical protein
MKGHPALAAALRTTLLAACASCTGGLYNQPYALFDQAQGSEIEPLQSAFVTAIDGVKRPAGDYFEPVTPGIHRVELSIPGPVGMSTSARDTLQVDAKPCVRYRFGARRSANSTDWHATLESTEPIDECRKKFPSVN